MSHGDWKELFKAVQQNDQELVLFYIHQGIDVNYQHPEFFTGPLFESIRLRHNVITELLLANGASLHEREVFSQQTPMQFAVEYDNHEAIKLLKAYS